MLQLYYISAFNVLKVRYGKKAINLALYYFTFLEFSIVFMLFCFFMGFARQFHLLNFPTNNVLTLGFLGIIGLLFKNWMKFTGKHRVILNAKRHSNLKIWQLILVPLGCLTLGLVFLQAQ